MTFCSLQSRAEGEISPAKTPLGPQPFCQTPGTATLSTGTAGVAAYRRGSPSITHTAPLSRTRQLYPPTSRSPSGHHPTPLTQPGPCGSTAGTQPPSQPTGSLTLLIAAPASNLHLLYLLVGITLLLSMAFPFHFLLGEGEELKKIWALQ